MDRKQTNENETNISLYINTYLKCLIHPLPNIVRKKWMHNKIREKYLEPSEIKSLLLVANVFDMFIYDIKYTMCHTIYNFLEDNLIFSHAWLKATFVSAVDLNRSLLALTNRSTAETRRFPQTRRFFDGWEVFFDGWDEGSV